jgi:molybdenum cofactor cytidylyltransferase
MEQQKLLLPIRGKPMITGIVAEILRSPVDAATIVLSANGSSVRDAIEQTNHARFFPPSPLLEIKPSSELSFVINPDPDSDMLSSVRCGIRALPGSCEAVLIILGDQPGLTATLIEKLIQTYRSARRAIIIPVHDCKRGHPLLFSTQYVPEVLTCYDGRGLHVLLDAHASEVVEVETRPGTTLQDLDTPQDYDRYIRQTQF